MIFRYINNIARNILLFLKFLSRTKTINWELVGSKIIDSNIHQKTAIYGRHTLNNATVEKGTYIAINARIYNTNIGKFCSIGPNFISGWGIHPIHGISSSPAFYSTYAQAGFTYSKVNKVEEKLPVTIGNDVFIGANVTVLDGVSIGDGAVIGAGAVVSKNIPPYAVAVGCPIKIIKYRFDEETIAKLLKSQWWNGDEATLHQVEEMFFDVEEFLKNYKGRDYSTNELDG